MQNSWESYFNQVDGLIYVVDSADFSSIITAQRTLKKALDSELLLDVPLLIFANKQDIRGARTAGRLTEDLDLTEVRDRPWHIQACSAISGVGLPEGLDWLAEKINEKHSFPNALMSVFSVKSAANKMAPDPTIQSIDH